MCRYRTFLADALLTYGCDKRTLPSITTAPTGNMEEEMAKFSKTDFTLAAIYRVGARRGFDRSALVDLIVARTPLKRDQAERLAGFWLSTDPYRFPATA